MSSSPTSQKRKAKEDDGLQPSKRGKKHSCQTYFRPISQVKHLNQHLLQKKAWIDSTSYFSVLRSVLAAHRPELDRSKVPTIKRKADDKTPHPSKKVKPLNTLSFQATKVFNSDIQKTAQLNKTSPSSSKTVKPLDTTLGFRVTKAINSDIRYFLYAPGKDFPNNSGCDIVDRPPYMYLPSYVSLFPRSNRESKGPMLNWQKRPQKKPKKLQKTSITGLVSWLQSNGAVD